MARDNIDLDFANAHIMEGDFVDSFPHPWMEEEIPIDKKGGSKSHLCPKHEVYWGFCGCTRS